MTLKLSKVRGQANQYVFTYDDGAKVVSWTVDGRNVYTEVLTDIVDTVHPAIPPTKPWMPSDAPIPLSPYEVAGILGPVTVSGAEAADLAARQEEMRLRNGGAALARGIGMENEGLPVVDSDRNDLPNVNWGV